MKHAIISLAFGSLLTHGKRLAPEANPVQAKDHLAAVKALDPSNPSLVATATPVNYGYPTRVHVGDESEELRAGMAKKDKLPTLSHDSEFAASGENIGASAVCECTGDRCVGKWVSQNVGCDVCVVFSCGNGSFPSSCVTCN